MHYKVAGDRTGYVKCLLHTKHSVGITVVTFFVFRVSLLWGNGIWPVLGITACLLLPADRSEELWLNITSAFGKIRPDCESDLEARFCESVQLCSDECFSKAYPIKYSFQANFPFQDQI